MPLLVVQYEFDSLTVDPPYKLTPITLTTQPSHSLSFPLYLHLKYIFPELHTQRITRFDGDIYKCIVLFRHSYQDQILGQVHGGAAYRHSQPETAQVSLSLYTQ